jgi:hypothetical protein
VVSKANVPRLLLVDPERGVQIKSQRVEDILQGDYPTIVNFESQNASNILCKAVGIVQLHKNSYHAARMKA